MEKVKILKKEKGGIMLELDEENTPDIPVSKTYYESFIQTKSAPTDIPTVSVKIETSILDTLKSASLGVSNSDIKRTLEQGGVELDGVKVTDPTTPITAGTLKFGKRTYRKIEIA